MKICAFQRGYQYRGQYWYGDSASSDADNTDNGEPKRDETLTNCTEYLDVWDCSGYTCACILSLYDIAIAQFYARNTDLGEDCSGLWLATHTPPPDPTGPRCERDNRIDRIDTNSLADYQYYVDITPSTDDDDDTANTTSSATIPNSNRPTQPRLAHCHLLSLPRDTATMTSPSAAIQTGTGQTSNCDE